MNERIINTILIIFLLADFSYSFNQYYHSALDGDMANIIVPAEGYSHVLKDPFGLGPLLEGERYAGPNRFFAHWTMRAYMLYTPKFLQNFVSPITSLYLSTALFKLGLHIGFVLLLAGFINKFKSIFTVNFLIACSLISPLLQYGGFNGQMAIIDISTTYAFFYAFPLVLLLLFLIPLYKKIYLKEEFKMRVIQIIGFYMLLIFLAFSGPLISPILLLVCPLILLNWWWDNFKLSHDKTLINRVIKSLGEIDLFVLSSCLIIVLVCLYSMYIGRFNAENGESPLNLLERYQKLPYGLLHITFKKLGLPLLLITTVINIVLIVKTKDREGQLLVSLAKWMSVFTTCYLLLLPLGGYRSYREDIIRYDTFMPVTICIVALFGLTSFYLMKKLRQKTLIVYVFMMSVVLMVFTSVDLPEFDHYYCERANLEVIVESSKTPVLLPNSCNTVEWVVKREPEQSRLIAELLVLWGVTADEKLFYQK